MTIYIVADACGVTDKGSLFVKLSVCSHADSPSLLCEHIIFALYCERHEYATTYIYKIIIACVYCV